MRVDINEGDSMQAKSKRNAGGIQAQRGINTARALTLMECQEMGIETTNML
ncbi:hypothetical protein [Paenibacillus oryzae]|uniref:hypothetical protein n=1 Tax=Paenibacillus oryzae TaxID=1844972 RepID=UPI0012EAD0E3|nr:hypothetical protein [Paenibacillus oryzae]